MPIVSINTVQIKYDIIDTPFVVGDKVLSQQTAIVEIYFEKLQKQTTRKLAFIDNQILKNSPSIQLENVFLLDPQFPDIMLDKIEIRNSILLSQKVTFSVKSKYKADFQKSIFVADEINLDNSHILGNTNFSETVFICNKLQLNNSKFTKGISFKYAEFFTNFFEFQDCVIEKDELNFSNSVFYESNFSLAHTQMGKGRKNFSFMNFGEGFKDFSFVDFGEGDVIFERTNFGKGNFSFRSADFGIGTVDFRRAEFGEGEKDFTSTNFNDGNVKFISTLFNSGKVNFRFANFGKGNIDFHFSHFGECSFLFDHIYSDNGNIDFRGTEFTKANISFTDVTVGDGSISFESFEQKEGSFTLKHAFFGRGTISFENAKCSKVDLNIENVDFGAGSVYFSNAEFNSISFKHSQINNYLDLQVKKCDIIDLGNTVINGVVDLRTSDFLNINQIYLQGVKLLGRLYIDWHRSNIQQIIISQKTTNYEKALQFRILKENYRNLGEYNYEDYAYVCFKRYEALDKIDRSKNKNLFTRFFYKIAYWFEWLILDKVGEYATNPIRVLVSMFVIYVLFSLIFWLIIHFSPQNHNIVSSLFPPESPNVLNNIARSFYHSIVTFLTIGYGDYYPKGIIRILSGVEGFIGLFMMSYFTVAFVRKILR